jgi:hypothetical protein
MTEGMQQTTGTNKVMFGEAAVWSQEQTGTGTRREQGGGQQWERRGQQQRGMVQQQHQMEEPASVPGACLEHFLGRCKSSGQWHTHARD